MSDRLTLQARTNFLKALKLETFESGTRKVYGDLSDEDSALDVVVLKAVVEKQENVDITYSKFMQDRLKARKTIAKRSVPKMLIVMDHSGVPGAIFLNEDQAYGHVGTHCKGALQQGTGGAIFLKACCFIYR